MLKPMHGVRFNKEQAKHLADTFRIVAIAQFGFFGYHGLIKWPEGWAAFVWSAILFAVLDWVAVRLLENPHGPD